MSAPFSFNPYAPEFNTDPFPALKELRENHPIHFWEGGQGWLLSDYEDCLAVMRDNVRFSANFQDWELAPAAPDSVFQRVQAKSLFGLPPARQTQVRKLIAPIFSAASMKQRRPQIRAIVDGILDEIGQVETLDVMSQVAERMPIRVMASVLDIPRQYEDMFKEFASLIVRGATPALNPEEHAKLNAAMPDGLSMLEQLINERRGKNLDDVLSQLVRAEEDGHRIDDIEELTSLVVQLVSAGSTSTINLIGYSLMTLLRHPDQLALVKSRPELLENAIMEAMRYDQFARFGLPRYALQDVTIRDTKIRKGQMVLPMVIGVMRDPARYPDPDRFDITRDQRNNLAFGHGPHFCLGAPLARLEGEEAVSALLARFPNLSLAGEPVFIPHPLMRYLHSLPVRTNIQASG
jgi:cytochrome P450 enzyme